MHLAIWLKEHGASVALVDSDVQQSSSVWLHEADPNLKLFRLQTPDDILDTRPDKLRLGLQPYLSLLELDYEVDAFLVALKQGESDALRGEASNTFEAMPHETGRSREVRMPKRRVNGHSTN